MSFDYKQMTEAALYAMRALSELATDLEKHDPDGELTKKAHDYTLKTVKMMSMALSPDARKKIEEMIDDEYR